MFRIRFVSQHEKFGCYGVYVMTEQIKWSENNRNMCAINSKHICEDSVNGSDALRWSAMALRSGKRRDEKMMIMISSTETKRLTERAKFEPNRTSKYFHFKSTNRSIKTLKFSFALATIRQANSFGRTNGTGRQNISTFLKCGQLPEPAHLAIKRTKKTQCRSFMGCRFSSPLLTGVSFVTI